MVSVCCVSCCTGPSLEDRCWTCRKTKIPCNPGSSQKHINTTRDPTFPYLAPERNVEIPRTPPPQQIRLPKTPGKLFASWRGQPNTRRYRSLRLSTSRTYAMDESSTVFPLASCVYKIVEKLGNRLEHTGQCFYSSLYVCMFLRYTNE